MAAQRKAVIDSKNWVSVKDSEPEVIRNNFGFVSRYVRAKLADGRMVDARLEGNSRYGLFWYSTFSGDQVNDVIEWKEIQGELNKNNQVAVVSAYREKFNEWVKVYGKSDETYICVSSMRDVDGRDFIRFELTYDWERMSNSSDVLNAVKNNIWN